MAKSSTPHSFGQQLGVAGIVVAGAVQRLLVQRRGGDGIDLPVQRQLGGRHHGVVGRLAGPGVDRARRHVEHFVGPAAQAGDHVRRRPGLVRRIDLDHRDRPAKARPPAAGFPDAPPPSAGTTRGSRSPTSAATISGPTPAGSPKVKAMSGLGCFMLTLYEKCPDFSRGQGRLATDQGQGANPNDESQMSKEI